MNRLVASLPRETYLRVVSELEPVELAAGSTVVENDERALHAYFPEDCVFSVQRTTRDGGSVEFGIVGREGVLGIGASLDGNRMHGRGITARAGRALRMPAELLRDLYRRDDRFRSNLVSFYSAFDTQVAQRSICHRVHTTEQHLCCWILLMTDRSDGADLEATHEVIGGLLGARREGVTLAIMRLRDDGLLRSARSRLTILDRAALEARSCECYGVIRQAYVSAR